MAFSRIRSVSFGSATIPSTQTDFPVMVYISDTPMKDVAHGGYCRTDGFDIRPYSNITLTTALSYELVYYDPVVGTVVLRVKISSFSTSTLFYLGYGDSSLTTDGSSTATWSNSYGAVYHLGNGTTLSGVDSVAGNNGTLNNATAGAGRFYGAASFDGGAHSFIDTTYTAGLTDFTASAWYDSTGTGTGTYDRIIDKNYKTGFVICRYAATANGWTGYIIDPTVSTPLSLTITDGAWHHIVLRRSGNSGTLKADGGAGSYTTTVPTTALDSSILKIGWSTAVDGYNSINGSIYEVNIATVARSDDWITTEYNNQVAPSTFNTIGADSPFGSSGIDQKNRGFFFMFP